MGGKLLDNKRVYEGYDSPEQKDDTDILKNKARRKEDVQDKESRSIKENKEALSRGNLVAVLSMTVEHYFPRFNEWLKELTDKRDQEAIDYKRETIVWVALVTMLTKRGARKKIHDQMRTHSFLENLSKLSQQSNMGQVPHGDTVEYLTRRMRLEEFDILQMKLMKRLFRLKVFERHRLQDKYHTIAIDGIHIHSFDYQHCDNCLKYENDDTGNIRWAHYKLQASLVTPDGFCMAVASEWIENEKGYDKQDCELKACYRLLEKLRKLYPKLPMCILLDSLYAGEPMFRILNRLRMQWIIVFKEGAMSEVFKWVMSMKQRLGGKNVITRCEYRDIQLRNKRSHEERLIRKKPEYLKRTVETRTVYTWLARARHWDGKRSFNIVTCEETEDGKKNCDYTWIVSDGLGLREETIVKIAQRGRCRWTIENQGINTQKNGGYNLEHLYSRDEVSMKIWCAILDIAHLINQLIERGSLIVKKTYGSIRNISTRMFEHFRYYIFNKPSIRPNIQIRLSWDSS